MWMREPTGSGSSSALPCPSPLPPLALLLLLLLTSPGLCAPSLAQPGLVQLTHGQPIRLPHAIREVMGTGRKDEPPSPTTSRDADQEKDGSSEWETVLDPRLYVITEYGRGGGGSAGDEDDALERRRRNNGGPSLSIVNPLDVLRQRLLFEIARRRMKQSHSQIMANNEILKNIGRK